MVYDEVCEQGLKDKHVRTGHLLRLSRRIERLYKVTLRACTHPISRAVMVHRERVMRCVEHHTIHGRPTNRERGEKSRFVGYDGEIVSVEELVLQHIHRTEGYEGIHCENALFHMLFGLFMWDVLFAPIANVFQTKFQDGPLDLNTDAFYRERAALIEQRIAEIRSIDVQTLLTEAWKHEGIRV